MDSVAGCDKDRTDALIDRSTVHIDGSTEWKYEGCDLTFGTKFLSTFQVDRQGSYGRSTGECKHDRRKHALEEFQRAHSTECSDSQ